MYLQHSDHIMFYGDSITDCGRGQNGLGGGYALFCAAMLSALYPEMDFTFTNRGTSGNRVFDLEERLDADVLAAEPDVVSILIGINDTWRRYDSGVISPMADFENSYRRILTKLADKETRLIICEPFALPIPDDRATWREDLDPRIGVCRALAREFEALYLPLDGIFAAAACRQSLDYWLPDGVHPTPAGHALIANHWIDLVTE